MSLTAKRPSGGNVGGVAIEDRCIAISNLAWVVHDDNLGVVLGCLKLPQGNINGDTTLTLSLQLVEHPGILE
ncbi:hypothetical protein ERO13_A10G207601v2 [Gossypium hirsutum]|nr:hypothetical protein ERO13_A10G207601v2 [Gossypium hirsutum]